MKKNTRVIQITGIKGLVMMLFIGSCLAAGFIAFPSLIAMKGWNYIANIASIPTINIWQGLMLWAIVAISGFIINDRKKYLIAFKANNKLNDDEIKKILDSVKKANVHSADSILKSNEKAEIDEREKENV